MVKRKATARGSTPRRLLKWEHQKEDDECNHGEYWSTEIKLFNGESIARIYVMRGFLMRPDEISGAPTTEVAGWAFEVSFDERASAVNIEGCEFAEREDAECGALEALANMLDECVQRLRRLAGAL